MKRVVLSILAGLLVCGFAWLWGFDFNERGGTALVVAYLTVVAAGVVYLFPGWNE